MSGVYENLRDIVLDENCSFDDLIKIIETCTSVIEDAKALREKAMAKADATGPYANRRVIGTAAEMSPSQVIRILERNGRPGNRRKAAEAE